MLAQSVASLALVYLLIGLSARLGCRFACINVESPACEARHNKGGLLVDLMQ